MDKQKNNNLIKIMVVDDSKLERYQISRCLEDLGYPSPITAINGEEGVELAGLHRPDLVLMDINLPGKLNGIEAGIEITKRFDIPIIFITAMIDESLIDIAQGADPVGYLVKPLNKLGLHGAIKTGLTQHQLVVELRQAVARVKLLSGLLPICAKCKKIKDDNGYWQRIETYISEHSQAEFSHGICPTCASELYPELMRDG